jgi:hypothetical protein
VWGGAAGRRYFTGIRVQGRPGRIECTDAICIGRLCQKAGVTESGCIRIGLGNLRAVCREHNWANVPLHRSSWNPSSLVELSAQLRLIWLYAMADDVRLLGAAGSNKSRFSSLPQRCSFP